MGFSPSRKSAWAEAHPTESGIAVMKKRLEIIVLLFPVRLENDL